MHMGLSHVHRTHFMTIKVTKSILQRGSVGHKIHNCQIFTKGK